MIDLVTMKNFFNTLIAISYSNQLNFLENNKKS